MHSREPADVQRGIELAEALTDSGGLEQRDLLYLVAVRDGGLFSGSLTDNAGLIRSTRELEQHDLLYLVAVRDVGGCCVGVAVAELKAIWHIGTCCIWWQ